MQYAFGRTQYAPTATVIVAIVAIAGNDNIGAYV
jgi:hypothetical protein